MDLGQHATFIVASYAFAGIVLAGFVLQAIRDNRAQKRALAELQPDGTRSTR